MFIAGTFLVSLHLRMSIRNIPVPDLEEITIFWKARLLARQSRRSAKSRNVQECCFSNFFGVPLLHSHSLSASKACTCLLQEISQITGCLRTSSTGTSMRGQKQPFWHDMHPFYMTFPCPEHKIPFSATICGMLQFWL